MKTKKKTRKNVLARPHGPTVLPPKEKLVPVVKTPPPPPPKKVPPPPPPRQDAGLWDAVAREVANTTQPLSNFREGSRVNIPGLAEMQGLTVERVGPSGVTVSGGKLAPHTVLSGQSPAVLCYERPAGAKEPGLTVVVPANGNGDFSSMPPGGTVRTVGKGPPGKVAPPTPTAKKPGMKKEGVCAFIDALIMEGTRTAEAIRDLTLAKFPGRDPQATLSTVKTRPAHIKGKGQVPPPFKK